MTKMVVFSFKFLLHTCMHDDSVYSSPFLCPLEDILNHVSRNIILFGDLQRPQSETYTECVHQYTYRIKFHSSISE